MKNLHSLSILISAMALNACSTNLNTSAVTKTEVAQGITYFLPQRTFHITHTIEAISCGVGAGDIAVLELSTSATIEDEILADPLQSYVINYEALNDKLKITSADVALYANGTLKSFNAAIEDRTGQVIGNLVKSGLSLAASIGGLPTPTFDISTLTETAPKKDKPTAKTYCTQELLDALASQEALKAQIKAEEEIDKVRAKLKKELADLQALLAAAEKGLSAALEASDHDKADSAAQLISEKKDTIKTATDVIGALPDSRTMALLAQLAKLRSSTLVRKITFDWTPSNAEIGSPKNFGFGGSLLQTWLTPAGACSIRKNEPQIPGVPLSCSNGDINDFWSNSGITVETKIDLLSPTNSATPTFTGTPKPKGGIVYRQPIAAHVSICKKTCAPSSETNRLISKTYQMPQFGVLAQLPLDNGPFDKNSLKLTMAADGMLITAEYASEAQLEKATTLLLNSVNQYGELRRANRAQRDGEGQAEIDAIKLEADKYDALKAREKSRLEYEKLLAE